jgi:transcription elongation regulator 1
MLKESKAARTAGPSGSQKKWNEVKKEFQKDPRYDAVGSSTLREELYETFLKSLKETKMEGLEGVPGSNNTVDRAEEADIEGDADGKPSAKPGAEEEKKRRRERAVREREERVKLEQERTALQNARSRAGLNLEEAELAFKCVSIPLATLAGAVLIVPTTAHYSSMQSVIQPSHSLRQFPISQ